MSFVIGVKFLCRALFDLIILARDRSKISNRSKFLKAGKRSQLSGNYAVDRIVSSFTSLVVGLIPMAAVAQSEEPSRTYIWAPFSYTWENIPRDSGYSPRYRFSSAADACSAMGVVHRAQMKLCQYIDKENLHMKYCAYSFRNCADIERWGPDGETYFQILPMCTQLPPALQSNSPYGRIKYDQQNQQCVCSDNQQIYNRPELYPDVRTGQCWSEPQECRDDETRVDGICMWDESKAPEPLAPVMPNVPVIESPKVPVFSDVGDPVKLGNTCRANGEFAGNPIYLPTGEKIEVELDYYDFGPNPLHFARTYRSNWAFEIFPKTPDGNITPPWVGNHSVSLSFVSANRFYSAEIVFGDGTLKRFSAPESEGVWPAADGSGSLKISANGYVFALKEDGSAWEFNTQGRILRELRRNGWFKQYEYNPQGRLSRVFNNFGREIVFDYNQDGLLFAVTAGGGVIQYEYNDRLLAAVIYPDGSKRQYVYGDMFRGALVGIIDENSVQSSTFTYDTLGKAIRTEKAEGALVYKASYSDVRVRLTDPLNTIRDYRYKNINSRLSVISATLPDFKNGKNAQTRISDKKGFITAELDYLNVQTSYVWDDEKGVVIKKTEGDGTPGKRSTSIDWHALWRLPVKFTTADRDTFFAYDEVGNLISQSVVDKTREPHRTLTTQWSYATSGLLSLEVMPNGARKSFEYSDKGFLVAIRNALNQVDSYAHDESGRVLIHKSPTALTTTYLYDARGLVLSVQRGDEVTSFVYRPSGQVETVYAPNGHNITYQYDAAQRLKGWMDNRGASANFTLDGMGNRTEENVKDGQGHTVWQLARTINNLNRVSSVAIGGGTSPTHSLSYEYDANGDLIRTTESVDGAERNTTLALDPLRRVRQITNAQNASAALEYNALDAVTKATDFKSVATTYARDALGNAKQEATPDIGTLTSTYDSLGLPQSITDALGRATAITRDALGRPTQIVHTQGGVTRTTVLRYDLPGGEYNAEGAPQASVGSLSEIQEAEVTTRYQRDLQGRITRKTEILANGDTRTLGYRYVPAGSAGAGQVAAIVYPSGRQLQHQYDTTGQLTGLQWNGQPLLSSITWNPLGQPTAWQWSGALGTGQAEQRSYTTAGQLASSRLLPQLVWDGAGRVARMQQRHALPGMGTCTLAQGVALTSVFTYDAAGRLTASAHSAPADLAMPQGWGLGDTLGATASGYAWDANGNRTQVHHTSATGAGAATLERVFAQSAGSNRLQGYTERFTPAGSTALQTTQVAYSQDAAGSLTKKGDTYLHYGVDGRIAKVGASADASNALAVNYVTNAVGQRVLKRDARLSGQNHPAITQQTVYAEDGIGSTVLGQYGNHRSGDSAAPASEMDSTEVIWLPTATGPMPVAAQINGRLYAIDADHLNTPRRLTNVQGQVVWQWLIAGFGEANPTTGATGYAQDGAASGRSYGEAVRFDLRYPGQVWDEETGLSYNLHRYYDAGTGRYVQADPIGLEGGWNRYAYANTDPLSKIDPTGLCPWCLIPALPYVGEIAFIGGAW